MVEAAAAGGAAFGKDQVNESWFEVLGHKLVIMSESDDTLPSDSNNGYAAREIYFSGGVSTLSASPYSTAFAASR